MSQIRTLNVTIMGRELRISCPEEEEASLRLAVEYLDEKMQQIRDAGKIVGVDRIAIMAALNITHELLHTNVDGDVDLGDMKRRMQGMSRLIGSVLAEQSQLF